MLVINDLSGNKGFPNVFGGIDFHQKPLLEVGLERSSKAEGRRCAAGKMEEAHIERVTYGARLGTWTQKSLKPQIVVDLGDFYSTENVEEPNKKGNVSATCCSFFRCWPKV